MAERREYDAIVVGAGPNGLTAAAVLARAGLRIQVREAAPTVGGGARTAELTLPGFWHDPGSAVHPLAAASPIFRNLPLAAHGLEWVHPPTPLAHLLDGDAVVLERSIDATAAQLGGDSAAYRDLMAPFVTQWDALFREVLAPLHLPRHPLLLARFGLQALLPAATLVQRRFREQRTRALFAGIVAHSMLPPARPPSAAFGLVLAIAGHAVGWPIPRGGAQRIASALAAYVHALDGEIVVDSPVRSLGDLPPARAVLLDLTPRQVLRVARDVLPGRYCHQLARYRYGPGVFKVDWALDGAIPWRDPAGGRAGTIHLGGTFEEIARGEAQVAAGRVPERLFVLLSQPTRFDPSRAPAGKHTAWAYCHVPHGYSGDMTAAIEAEVERAAPGFRDLILARHAMGPPELERHNPNLVGGDIAAGVPDLKQLLFRPVLRLDPYATPNPRLFICSSATPPGPGVHGLCGYFAARSALRRVFGKRGLQIEG